MVIDDTESSDQRYTENRFNKFSRSRTKTYVIHSNILKEFYTVLFSVSETLLEENILQNIELKEAFNSLKYNKGPEFDIS